MKANFEVWTGNWIYDQFCIGYPPSRFNPMTGVVQVGECRYALVDPMTSDVHICERPPVRFDERRARKFWSWRTVAKVKL